MTRVTPLDKDGPHANSISFVTSFTNVLNILNLILERQGRIKDKRTYLGYLLPLEQIPRLCQTPFLHQNKLGINYAISKFTIEGNYL